MTRVMSPRVVLAVVAGDGHPPLPEREGSTDIHDGRPAEWQIGSHPAREYRHPSGRLTVITPIAPVTLSGNRPGALAIVWVPSTARTGDNAKFAELAPVFVSRGLLAKSWACAQHADGTLRVPELDADQTPAGQLARAAWPASWRVRLPTDDPGDPFASPPRPPAAPTGPRCIGAVIA